MAQVNDLSYFTYFTDSNLHYLNVLVVYIPRAEPVPHLPVLLSCVKALQLLQNDSLSLVSPPQTVLLYTVTFYCLCAGRCVQSWEEEWSFFEVDFL